MKYIKLFEAFNSKLITKLSKFLKLRTYIIDTLKDEDIIVSNITDIYEDEKLIEFTSAIDGYNKKLGRNYLKFFINDISDLQFILHGDNNYFNKMSAGFNKIDEEYVIFNTDFCLILNIDKIKEKYSGYEELKNKRVKDKEGAFDMPDDIKDRNIERYENIIFSKYGFFDEERNLTEGLRLFFNKVLEKMSPVLLITLDDFYTLFLNIKEYQMCDEDDKEEYKKEIIKKAKRLINYNVFILDDKIDNLPNIFKDLHGSKRIGSYNSDSVDFIFNNILPIIKNFNKNFTFDKVLSDKIDLIVISQQIVSMQNMISNINSRTDNLESFIKTLSRFYVDGELIKDEHSLNVKLDNLIYYSPEKESLKKLDYTLKTFLRILK